MSTTISVVLLAAGALLLVVIILSALAPTRVTYEETIDVDAPAEHVFDDIRLQDRLMRWSAWPGETKSQCAVAAGPDGDGAVGARTVFVSKGRAVGHQEIVRIVGRREVAMTLVGPGPPHEPSLRFELEALTPTSTRVHLHFVNEIRRPFNAIWRFAGLSRWTREMHRKDLAGLKNFVEPPHRDADGRVVGRPPTLPNPHEVPLPG
ncbi:MAG: SRPBCC family protein [Myxococcota bacterium]